jgi:hypothetical protein
MQTEPPRQFPNPFDGIQVRAVGRQVAQGEFGLLLRPPSRVQRGVMIFGVVDDHHHAPSRPSAAAPQFFQEAPGRHPIKAARFAAEEEFTVPQADSSKVADAFACGSMEQNWIVHLGRNPHPAAGAVLLKMNFIDGPEVNGGIVGQGVEFFYARLALSDRLEPPPGAVCGSGSPIVERAAGTDAL